MDEDDDDAETYFAYSSDDMLRSKVCGTGNAGEPSPTGGLAPSNSTQVSETSIPNFLLKLWKLVEDDRYNQCIEWDPTGFSFHVREPYGFSKDVLPLYFKHSNLNSFIRQLNMYGFRKVTNLEKGALKQQTDQDSLEFQHPYFVRGHPELLQYIKRKISNPRTGGELDVQQHSSSARGLNQVLEELRQLRDKQFGMDSRLNHIKKENGTLWREVAHMRQLHMKQQQVVNKLIQFLLSLVQPAAGKRLGKRQLLAIGPGLLAEQDKEDQPAKRPRSDSSPSSAVHIIESLEQELQNSGRLSFMSPANTRSSISGGPIIADVTDDPEHYDIHEQAPQGDVAAGNSAVPIGGLQQPATGGMGTQAYPHIIEGDGGLDDSMMQAPAQSRQIGNHGYDMLSPNSLGTYKEPDSYPNGATSSASTQQKAVSPQSIQQVHPQQQQQVSAVVQRQQVQPARPMLNRSFSECDTTPSTAYTNPEWMRSNQGADGEPGRWSKPEFSEYLDFVQTDLDSLRDFLTSGSLSVDQDSLSNLFTMADESSNLAVDPPHSNPVEIVGNEVQVYKRPEILVNFDGTPRMDPTYGVNTAASVPVNMNIITTLGSSSAPVPAGVAAMPRATTVTPQMIMPHPVSMPQQVRPMGSGVPSIRPNEQVKTRQGMNEVGRSDMMAASMVSPNPNVIVTQPVYVLSPPLQQGIVGGMSPTSQTTQQHTDDQRDNRATLGRGKSMNRR